MGFFDELISWSEAYGENTAVEEYQGLTRTYRELSADIADYAEYYRQLECNRIAVLGATVYEWFCNAYGALAAGKTMIAMDALLPVEDIVTLLKYADAECVFTDEKDRKIARALEQEHIVYETYPQPEHEDDRDRSVYRDGDIMFFTSGTSGMAKGVVVPFGALYRNAAKVKGQLAGGYNGKVYIPTPTGHLYANFIVLSFWNQGRTLCMGNPRRMVEEIAYFKPAVLSIVASLAEYLLLNGKQGENARVITVAGSKCEKSLEELAEKHGIRMQNLYGASETAGAAAMSRIEDSVDHLTPVEGVELTLEEDGELVIHNPDVMTEYYKKPQETAEVLKNGCIYLKDIAARHEDGTLDILGRKQDMISMKNGSKLYYNEVDEELSQIGHVREACTLYTDDRIVAVIVADEEWHEQVLTDIRKYNKKQPYFRKIEDIWIRQEAFERTGMGKLVRRNVLEEYRKYKEQEQ